MGRIILHPDELPIGNKPIVWLKYLPAYILVKLTWTWVSRGWGCHPCEACKYIKIKCTVHHWQFPITAAYVFTNYSKHYLMFWSTLDLCPVAHQLCSTFILHCPEFWANLPSGFSGILTRTCSCSVMMWHWWRKMIGWRSCWRFRELVQVPHMCQYGSAGF